MGRYLLKAYQNAKSGQELSELTACLSPLKDPRFNPARDGRPKPAKSIDEVCAPKYLLEMFRYRVLVAVNRIGKQFESEMKQKDSSFDSAFNSCALGLQMTAVSFTMYFMLSNFIEVLEQQTDPNISRALGLLVSLYGLCDLQEGKQWSGLFDSEEVVFIDTAIVEILDKLRPDVVSLVDAFDFPDAVLNSTIGRYDGNVYEALFEAAVNAPLNAHPNKPFKGYDELRKSLDLEFLKLRNDPAPELRDDDARAKL